MFITTVSFSKFSGAVRVRFIFDFIGLVPTNIKRYAKIPAMDTKSNSFKIFEPTGLFAELVGLKVAGYTSFSFSLKVGVIARVSPVRSVDLLRIIQGFKIYKSHSTEGYKMGGLTKFSLLKLILSIAARETTHVFQFSRNSSVSLNLKSVSEKDQKLFKF